MAITQGTNGQVTEASAFEAERSRLITNIQNEMGQVLSNVNILNRNLETIITIGQEFEQLSQLWKHFHASAFQRAEEERFEREAAEEEQEQDQDEQEEPQRQMEEQQDQEQQDQAQEEQAEEDDDL